MVKIPEPKHTTLKAIDEQQYGGKPRTYLGMSSIGEECSRKLWYGFHWVVINKHDARRERIFNAGHLFEAQIISQMKDAGMEVFRVDEDGNEIELFGHPDEEQEEIIGFAGGHEKGHCDGRVRKVIEAPKTTHLLELKTMAEKYWKECKRKGVRQNNPVYYAQMQRYMLEMKLDRALFIALNKNTCELYIERVELDKSFAEDLRRKGAMIVVSDEPPVRAYREGFYKCNFCGAKEVCWEDKEPEKNCRTCEFADIEDNGQWSCQKKDGKILPVGLQRKGCSKYQKGWGL